jgi:hypothetical protein
MSNAGPFVCNMTALSSEQRSRHQELVASLQTRLRAIREISDGYDFEFPFEPAIYDALAQITPLEHACCPFFAIGIRLDTANRLFWQLTGDQGIKQFVELEFSGWFKAVPPLH